MMGRGVLLLLAGGTIAFAASDTAVSSTNARSLEVQGSHPGGAASATYHATIRRTPWGVAHIEAADLGSLGFGEGYAQAEDHLCTIADQVVRARGERAKYFGRGENNAHLNSDIAVRAVRIHEGAAELLAAEPPEIQEWVAGFAAGYNQYLAEVGADAVPGWCQGEPWVQPIGDADIPAIQRLNFGVLSAPALLAGVTPPTEAARSGAASASDPADAAARIAFGRSLSPPGASNGWALGREMTESGRGMLLAQPHYAWIGSNRFWEKHLRIPGELDVYGMHLIGHPGVIIGFNEHVAWTHTVPAGTQFTLYAVDLVPGQPTRYRYGDEERDMVSREVVIEVRGEPGPVRRTLWSTRHGPLVANGPLQRTAGRAYALRDANADNGALLRHVLATGRAGSMQAFQDAHEEHQGLPWLNTIAASADGVAWYADGSVRPHVGPGALAEWRERRESDPVTAQLWEGGVVLLNGSDPAADWVDDPDARRPGIVPFREAPQLERTDYVFNANDSFWLAHADTLLEAGISPLYGRTRSALAPRSRSNVLHLTNATPDRPAGEDGRFNLRQVQEAALGNWSLTGGMLVPDLVTRCRATPSVALDGETVDLSEACDVLAGWDHRFDLDSRGAVLFREWIGHYGPAEFLRAGTLFAVDFDPGDPIRTPHTLAPGPLALENLARAVVLMEARSIPLDVPLGELQYAPSKLPARMPVHGGQNHWEGPLNAVGFSTGPTTLEPTELAPSVEGSRFLTEAGYPVLHATSFLMALEFTDDGPRAEAILTYGQSGDPESEHFTDQTEMFSRKEWRPVLFRPEEVAAGARRTYTVGGAPTPELPALAALDEGWNTLHPGGETGCAWGGAYAFHVRPGNPERVFIHMYGGGGCWDEETCPPGRNYVGEIEPHLHPDRQGGVLDASHLENPFRDHLMVAVPYCTADVHLGVGERRYTFVGDDGEPSTVTIRHRGRANVDAVLDWLESNAGIPQEIFLAGGSAGGFAAAVYGSMLARRHPHARVTVLGDDIGAYRAQEMLPGLEIAWRTREALADEPGWEDLWREGMDTAELYSTAAALAPNLTLNLVDHAHDQGQALFLGLRGNPEPDLPFLIRQNHERIRRAHPGFRGFLTGGVHHEHLNYPVFYRYLSNGVRLRDWVAALPGDGPVHDVDCAPRCLRPDYLHEPADLALADRALELLSAPGAWDPDHDGLAPCPPDADRYALQCAIFAAIRELSTPGDFWMPPLATPVFFEVVHEILERSEPPVSLYLAMGWYNSRPGATAKEMISVLEAVRDRIRRGLASGPQA